MTLGSINKSRPEGEGSYTNRIVIKPCSHNKISISDVGAILLYYLRRAPRHPIGSLAGSLDERRDVLEAIA
jgi:hypothetical protein